MKRRAFNVLAAVSLVMALAVAGLWARSVCFAEDLLFLYRTHWALRIETGGGAVSVRGYDIESVPSIVVETGPPSDGTRWLPALDIHLRSEGFHGMPWSRHPNLVVADWVLILIFSPLPTAWLVMRLRRCKPAGLCTKCGYDLRGTATGRACPECGAERASAVTDAKAGAR